MTARVFRRPPRSPIPDLSTAEITLNSPPKLPQPDGQKGWMTALPAFSGLGSVAYMFAGPPHPITYVAGSMFLLSSLAMVGANAARGRSSTKTTADQRRRDYTRYLARIREQVRQTAKSQYDAAHRTGPDPSSLWTTALSNRLWERRTGDPDFGVLRAGVGPQTLGTPLIRGDPDALADLDPASSAALDRFVGAHATVSDVPIFVRLRQCAAIGISGPDDARRGLARALIAQAATFHAPGDLRIALCVEDPDGTSWSWVKWLGHAADPGEVDGLGPVRLMHSSLPALEQMLGAELANRPHFDCDAVPDPTLAHVLVVLDGVQVGGANLLLDPRGLASVTVMDLDGSAKELVQTNGVAVQVDSGLLVLSRAEQTVAAGSADSIGIVAAESLARVLAGVALDSAAGQTEDGGGTGRTLPVLLGVADPGALDLAALWKPRSRSDRLRVSLGDAVDGSILELDLKESAEGGVGPHGLVVGATGSGKSELLRTLVLAAAATHSSETLNLVLVDFKGGASFTGMSALPHVAAVITNLYDELPLVDRMQEALTGEVNRRQEILRAAGNLSSVREYERVRAAGAQLAPLPSLVIVVDEFSELLAQKPEFADLFVQIGRLGRSLGMHLILASQRLEEGRLRGLESHLSYRIALRTFSAAESRSVLGVPDAYDLPNAPGHGFLRADGAIRQFKAAFVSGSYRSPAGQPSREVVSSLLEIRPFTAAYQLPVQPARHAAGLGEADSTGDQHTVMSVMVDQLSQVGPEAHRVWLAPLEAPDSLDLLYGDLADREGRGFGAHPGRPMLQVPIGIVDKPYHQRRDPLTVDLAGAGGHLAIVGGPRSGKSTLATTLIGSLALRHTPREVQIYGLDFSGGAMFAMAALPHVGALAGRQDPDLVRRIVAQVIGVVDRRERRFRGLGIDAMADYRTMRADGTVGDDAHGDVFLMIDGLSVLRRDFEDVETTLLAIAARALTYGVHLVLTANRWLDVRLGLRDLVGTKLELRLGDVLDSEIDRRTAALVPPDRPGRGMTMHRAHYLAAVPRIDGRCTAMDLATGVRGLVQTVAAAWSGPVAPRVHLLPTSVQLESLPTQARSRGICIGIDGRRLEPVVLTPGADPGLVVLGDAESGKTSFLRAVGRQILDRWPPTEAKLVLFDYRRTMLGEFVGASLLGYAATAEQAREVVSGLIEGLQRRLPPTDVTPEQLRTRTWWTGPEVFIIVDDYDLVSSSTPNPLLPLVEFLSQARDIGVHLFLARRAGGAGRSMLDPVMSRARELGFPGVVLSAPADEGLLFGARPQAQPVGRGLFVDRRLGTMPIQLVGLPGPGGELR